MPPGRPTDRPTRFWSRSSCLASHAVFLSFFFSWCLEIKVSFRNEIGCAGPALTFPFEVLSFDSRIASAEMDGDGCGGKTKTTRDKIIKNKKTRRYTNDQARQVAHTLNAGSDSPLF